MRISDSLAESLLKRSGSFSVQQLADLRAQLRATKRPLQDLIIENGLLSETELTKLYADEVQLPFVEVPISTISHRVLTRLPEHVATRYRAVVFDIDNNDNSILVAMEDPDDSQALNFLQKQLGNNVKLHITTPTLLKAALNQYPGTRPSTISTRWNNAEDSQSAVAGGSAAVDSVHHILEQALQVGASTIHIEPRPDHVVIRYRIDGLLREAYKLPSSTLHPLIGYIKSASHLKLDEHSAPQYGQWNIAVADQHYSVRVTIVPAMDGEKVVLRIMPENTPAPKLQELGLLGSALIDLQKALTEPHGAIFITGPVNAGKSTTLFSLLTTLNTPHVNIATLEDPLEYRIAGANQLQVNPAAGVTFMTGLQAILNQDPNIVMVSDIRDGEVGALAIQAATSGHFVLSTLHTTNTASGVRRLLDMGIEPFLVNSTVRAMVGQRLARRLCLTCREVVTPDASTLKAIEKAVQLESYGGYKYLHKLEALAIEEGLGSASHGKTAQAELSSTSRTIHRLWQAHEGGCDHCNYSGYRGSIGIFEVMTPTAPLEKAITHMDSASAINQAAQKSGMISMQLDGLIKALCGQTSLAEVLRVCAHG